MGRVTTEVSISNLDDLYEARRGRMTSDQVRKVVVPDALVDTGASTLALTPSLIALLGLTKLSDKRINTAAGPTTTGQYDAVRMEIMGREATVDPIEIPEGTPILIGQIPLEAMDWVVDLGAQKLIGNPAHGGEHIIEMY